jgi:uncharacterized protein (DUF58 family)
MPADLALFPPEFLTALHALRIAARRVPRGGKPAEQASKARGSGIELLDLRQYAAGDEFRAIDWQVWQRLDRLFVRVYLEDRDLPLYFLLDRSASMRLRDKQLPALQALAALAAVALQQMDRISVYPFADQPFLPLPGTSGKNGLFKLLEYLQRLPDGAGTSLVEELARFASRPLRRGLCVLVSDLYDPRGLPAVLESLSHIPHRMLVVRPVRKDEARPRLEGELEVLDCESGESLALSVDQALLDRYENAYEAFRRDLAAFANARGIGVLELLAEDPVVPQVAQLFARGELRI